MLCKERGKYVKITWLFSPCPLISPVDAEKENWSGDAEQPGYRVDQDNHAVGHSANFLYEKENLQKRQVNNSL